MAGSVLGVYCPKRIWTLCHLPRRLKHLLTMLFSGFKNFCYESVFLGMLVTGQTKCMPQTIYALISKLSVHFVEQFNIYFPILELALQDKNSLKTVLRGLLKQIRKISSAGYF